MPRAAIYIFRAGDAPVEKQERLAVAHCTERGYTANTIVFHPEDAFALVRQGVIDVIVTAYDPGDEDRMAANVTAAGGGVEYVRKPRRRGLSWDLVRAIGRMSHRGMSVAEICEVTGEQTGDIRSAISRINRHGC